MFLLIHFYKLSRDFNFNPSFLNQELTKEQAWYHYFEKIILKKQLMLGLHKRDSSTLLFAFSLSLWMELRPNIDMRKLDCPLFENWWEWWWVERKSLLRGGAFLCLMLCWRLKCYPYSNHSMTCQQTSNIGPEWWDM